MVPPPHPNAIDTTETYLPYHTACSQVGRVVSSPRYLGFSPRHIIAIPQ